MLKTTSRQGSLTVVSQELIHNDDVTLRYAAQVKRLESIMQSRQNNYITEVGRLKRTIEEYRVCIQELNKTVQDLEERKLGLTTNLARTTTKLKIARSVAVIVSIVNAVALLAALIAQ